MPRTRGASLELLVHLPPEPLPPDVPVELAKAVRDPTRSGIGTPVPSDAELPEQSLLAAFGFGRVEAGAIPGARLSFPRSTHDAPLVPRVCADPIHLVADRTTARFDAGEALSLDAGDAERCVDTLNALFGEDGIRLEPVEPWRWSLVGLDATALDTWPTRALRGRSLNGWLPSAADAGPWRRLLTEAQMSLHGHAVNAERAARGQPPVNGLWCWGGAALPERVDHTDWVVCSDEPFARGLAELTGCEHHPLDAWPSVLADAPPRLVVYAPYIDVEQAQDIRHALVEQVEAGVVAGVRVESGDRDAVVIESRARPWWSRLLPGRGRRR